MSKGVDPVWRWQGKSHWAFPAQASTPSISPPTPTKLKRTLAIAGLAQLQSVMPRPSGAMTTQLISTAPPSIFTQAGIRQARQARLARQARPAAVDREDFMFGRRSYET